MSWNAQWLPGARRRAPGQQPYKDQAQHVSYLSKQAALWDAYEAKHMFDTRRSRLAKHFLSTGTRSCGICWSRMSIPARWLQPIVVLLTGAGLTLGIWLSEDTSLLGLPWPLHGLISAPAASNILLLALAGASYALFAPRPWRGPSSASGRPILLLQAKTLIFFFWIALNVFWFVAGVRERDFRKPSWLKQTLVPSRAQHFSEPMLRVLRLCYGVGMASAWPLLGNAALVLLPVDRGLLLLAGLGAGHEEGVLAHALCGTAVWVWAAAHALLTQVPMLAAGLWRVIMLPSLDGSETKAVRNFMGLLAFLCLCVLGISSLAPLRRRAFNVFQWLHLAMAPAVLLFGCLHDTNVFWYCMLGAVLYGADLVQRWGLRRRAVIATATLYPLPTQPLAPTPARVIGEGVGAGDGVATTSNRFVVLRVQTGCAPRCVAGQHVFIQVPAVSRWEWHPYSVAAHDDSSFALVIKAGGDWERRLCRAVELAATDAGSCSARLDVLYEGMYGTSDLQAATAAADRVLLFAGGSGITPVASVLQSLLTAAPSAAEAQPALVAAKQGASPAKVVPLNFVRGAPDATAAGAAAEGGWAAKDPLQPLGGSGGMDIGMLATAGATAVATAAAAAAATEAVAAAASSRARVHLVWAVTQQSDAQPLLPLLRAAASRGWRVDLHCTRLLPSSKPTAAAAGPQVAIVCRDGGHPTVAAVSAAVLPAPSAMKAMAATGGDESVAAAAATLPSPPPPRSPWQLHGAACWVVAAAAALLGAAGANLGDAAASVHSCKVAAPADASGGGNGIADWMASVRAAFAPHAAGGDLAGGRWAGTLLAAVLQGSSAASVFSCPASLVLPWGDRLRAGAGAATDGFRRAVAAAADGTDGGMTAVSLQVCRAWGGGAPDLCVKCDPFKPSTSELERAWPCCQAHVCFFAARLAPLMGWVAGLLLGAALVCAVWRWRSAAAAGRRGAGGRRRQVLAARGSRTRTGEAAVQPLLRDEGCGDEAIMAVADVERSMEEGAGAAGAAPAPGLEAMVSGLMALAGGQEEGDELVAAAGTSASDGGVFVHVGRPDVDAYIRAAAATGDAAGCGRYGRSAYGDAVYGVVVCGPESLNSTVACSYERHLRMAYSDSWFRGFSFTT